MKFATMVMGMGKMSGAWAQGSVIKESLENRVRVLVLSGDFRLCFFYAVKIESH